MFREPRSKWHSSVAGLCLEKRLELNVNDIGCQEAYRRQIRRFSGSMSPSILGPNEDEVGDENDRFDRPVVVLGKTLKAPSSRIKGGAITRH